MPTSDDLEFKQIILERNLVTPGKLEECIQDLENYEQAGIPKPLAGILLDKELVTQDQVSGIYKLLNKGDAYFVRGYTILETLGQGGLGIVYKARRDNTGMIVALKIMYPNFVSNKDFVRRFMKEAKFSCQLNHNNVVKGIDFGESNGIFYFAMEYVEGVTLKAYIKQYDKIEEKKAADLILQVAKALKYIETHSLIHRDIKPDNIMLTGDNQDVKVCDLGLAKCMDDSIELTVPGVVLGTPHYMSPEQGMAGGVIDIRSDIYSLGITLFHVVGGEVPYQGNTAVSILNQHVSADIPSLKKIRSDVSEDMCNIICKMMAKKQEERYQSSEDLIVDLERFLRSESPLLVSQPIQIPKKNDDNDITQQRTVAMSSSQEIEVDDSEDDIPTVNIDNNVSEVNNTSNETSGKTSIAHWEEITNGKSKKKKLLFLLLFVGLCFGGAYIFEDKIRNYIDEQILKKKRNPKIASDLEDIPLKVIVEIPISEKRKEKYEKEWNSIQANTKNITSEMIKISSDKNLFWIDSKEVSNKNYSKFCTETNHDFPLDWDTLSANLDAAVINITWYDASLYAKWAGKRLPTEKEWILAAKSAKKVLKMPGGIWEWTESFFGTGRKDRVIKGGDFLHKNGEASLSYQDGFYQHSQRKDIGFRCVYSVEKN